MREPSGSARAVGGLKSGVLEAEDGRDMHACWRLKLGTNQRVAAPTVTHCYQVTTLNIVRSVGGHMRMRSVPPSNHHQSESVSSASASEST